MITAAVLCLATAVYHEARGEDILGQLAVAHVIHTRAGKVPSRYCSVLREPAQFPWMGSTLKVVRESPSWKTALAVAQSFQYFPDPTFGATHFHEIKARPAWRTKYRFTRRIGYHVFYKWY